MQNCAGHIKSGELFTLMYAQLLEGCFTYWNKYIIFPFRKSSCFSCILRPTFNTKIQHYYSTNVCFIPNVKITTKIFKLWDYLYYRNDAWKAYMWVWVLASIMLLAGASIKVFITIHLSFFKTFIDIKNSVPLTGVIALVDHVWYKRDSKWPKYFWRPHLFFQNREHISVSCSFERWALSSSGSALGQKSH